MASVTQPDVPVRTCVGCRRPSAQFDLLRVVAQDSFVVPDPKRRLPGRGASVHPTLECVTAARPRWTRALRVRGPLDDSQLLIGTPLAPARGEDATDRKSAVRTSTR